MLRRAATLRERGRFCLRELGGRRSVGRYRTADHDTTIFLRHASQDLYALDEVLVDREYSPPPRVRELLQTLAAPVSVMDLGANIGLFSVWAAAELGAARVLAFEPDPGNGRILAMCAEANRGLDWSLHAACASNAAGTVNFAAGEFLGSRIVDSGGIEVPAVDVFSELDSVSLLKIDIEGGEWSILGDERFAGIDVPAVVVEYHPHLCPGPDPRRAAMEALRAAGYAISEVSHDQATGQGVVWGWRPPAQRARGDAPAGAVAPAGAGGW